MALLSTPSSRANNLNWAWIVALALIAVLYLVGQNRVPWAFNFPDAWVPPVDSWISTLAGWVITKAHVGPVAFIDATRALAQIVELPYQGVLALLATGLPAENDGTYFPPISWFAMVALAFIAGWYLQGWRLGALIAACVLYIAAFGQWTSAMVTLSSIVVAVPLGAVGGLILGLASYRWRTAEQLSTPVLDLMQTVPIFAYLVPMLFMFGFTPISAIMATVLYALPPMARLTLLSLKTVPTETKELALMVGCTRRQTTWKILIPSAMPGIMLGINQVIMLSLNMVIIASMIGAGGLGFDVLLALRRLDIGGGLQAGLAIVALAVALDRLSQATARHVQRRHRYTKHGRVPGTILILVGAVLALGYGTSYAWPGSHVYPATWTIDTSSYWNELVRWVNLNWFGALNGAKATILINVLIPLKRFLLELPWVAVVGFLGVAAFTVGGPRLMILTVALSIFIVCVGLWDPAVATVNLCGVSVVVACVIGIPIGILVADRDRIWRWFELVMDTLQTLPAFVYLIPVIMLFQVGEFSAMIAIIAYSIVPVIRYTALGLRQVSPQMIEAGIAAGCTPWQVLTKVRLWLAFPEILLGINQTVMLAISMLVVTALIGTRDLGQEVYVALTKADIGKGVVAGLCVAFLAIVADRMITAGTLRSRQRLGLVT